MIWKTMAKAEFRWNIDDGAPADVLHVAFSGESCVKSSISWSNASLMHGLRAMFTCREDEEVVAVSMTVDGVTAEIRRKT